MKTLKEGDLSLIPTPWYAEQPYTCSHCGALLQAETAKDLMVDHGSIVVVGPCTTCGLGEYVVQPKPQPVPFRWPWQRREEQA